MFVSISVAKGRIFRAKTFSRSHMNELESVENRFTYYKAHEVVRFIRSFHVSTDMVEHIYTDMDLVSRISTLAC